MSKGGRGKAVPARSVSDIRKRVATRADYKWDVAGSGYNDGWSPEDDLVILLAAGEALARAATDGDDFALDRAMDAWWGLTDGEEPT